MACANFFPTFAAYSDERLPWRLRTNLSPTFLPYVIHKSQREDFGSNLIQLC